MEFVPAVTQVLKKYAVFTDRASRSEYWWFILFNFLASVVAGLVGGLLGDQGVLSALVSLGLLLPGLAVGVRRLHDIDRSGWWLLLALLPLVGAIILIVWACFRGTPGPNRFGPDPLAGLPTEALA